MARPTVTAATILLVVLSLLAVVHCRGVVADHHATEPESTATVAVSDVNGQSDSNPTIPAEAGASAAEEVALPAEQQRHGFLRLPSHRPCHLQWRIWLGRHHGVYLDLEAPPERRSLFFRLSRHGESRDTVSHLAVLPAEDVREALEVDPVAEPDPDRSLPDSDGEGEPSFGDADGAHGAAGHHEDDERAAARAWKKEMLRRWFPFHFHHGMQRHRLHHIHHDEEEEAAQEGMKRFHFHHHHDKEDEEKNTMRKRLRHAEAEHGEDSDDEDEEVEEMVRRFRKAIMRSRRTFGPGGRFHHHHHSHRDAEEAAEKKADGEEESGVMAWIKGLMNQF